MNGLKIPFTGLKKQYNNLRTEILDATDAVLRSGQLMDGNNTVEFENWLAKKNKTRYAVTCHSGTQALEILAVYMRDPGFYGPTPPRAVVPAMTFPATANAFIRAGWDVVIADTDYHGLIDFKKIDRDLSIQAIVGVGLYGHALDTHEWGSKGNTFLIEDAAQHWLANDCARVSNATAISFDPMKNLSNYGNGGAIVTNDIHIAEFARACRNNGKPSYVETGTNSRMSEVDCAQMLVKTQYIDQWQKRRGEISWYWIQRLKGSKVRPLIDEGNHKNHAYHKFVIDVDNRDILQRNLQIRGIETKIHYKEPLHELTAYSSLPGPDMLSAASSMARRVLTLPLYPELTDLEVEYIIDQLLDCV